MRYRTTGVTKKWPRFFALLTLELRVQNRLESRKMADRIVLLAIPRVLWAVGVSGVA